MAEEENLLPEFQSRRPSSDLEYVYNALKQSFMMGEFVPGQKLTLPVLANAFGTSQMPIREATNRLVVARAIESLPRRSLRVPEATLTRLDTLLPLRLQLEGEATRLATLSASANLVKTLKAINEEMYSDEVLNDVKRFLRLNEQFHFTLYKQSNNEDLVDLIELLWMRYGPLMNIIRNCEMPYAGKTHHNELIAAIEAGNADDAKHAICEDIQEAANAIRKVIEQQ
ncbi:GntR family transcriptional regulator [Leeia sp. TBRC 13508]|uniref:GntR family transcriptional regulator n=1 Tax=Leeia speluncae TaxID=2884804 RepID=A0ABS8DB35_9NEIS|nr:GntR family transcriptional regulator [Leeia speluncae]MCB6185374.1 GntR family transcriptional regulator [Leeia speluncae]